MTNQEIRDVRETCAKFNLAGLAVICEQEGISAKVAERIAEYLHLLVDGSAREAASVASSMCVATRLSDRLAAAIERRKF